MAFHSCGSLKAALLVSGEFGCCVSGDGRARAARNDRGRGRMSKALGRNIIDHSKERKGTIEMKMDRKVFGDGSIIPMTVVTG